MKTGLSLILRILLGGAILLLAFISTLPLIPPRAVPADAPSTRFSAERAMSDLAVIAREPHGAGSDAQARVREYILAQAGTLGLRAEIQASGPLSNILVRLPGTGSTGTILVTGHYDSNTFTPGAGDDGISTAAMLEAMRVLSASPPLQNDVLFLFTDGEELGWLGAIAYLYDHPQAKQEVGVVLCFDARPGNGPLSLRQTSPGDAWLVRKMTGLPLRLWAGSWTNREERTDHDTDFETFQTAGFTGVEIENLASGTRYHTARDTVDAISPNVLQAYGQAMLALTNRFGTVDLRTRSTGPDLTYFTLPLVGLVAHPIWVTPILSGLGLFSLPGFMVIAWRRKLFSPGRLGWSLLGLLFGMVLIVICAQLLWGVILKNHAVEVSSFGGFESSAAWLSGLMVGAMLLMVVLLAFLSHRLGAINLIPAAAILYLLVWFTVHFLMGADNPLTTAYIAWPLLGSVAGMGILLFIKNPAWKAALLAFCALVILILMVPQLWQAAYTREDAWIPILASCISLGLFASQVDAVFGSALHKDG